MRLVRYFREHLGAVALVFVLLVAQAFCDLMLPNYTAQIVDVGIQQAGISRVAPSELSASTYDAISSQLAGEEAALFERAYQPTEQGTYALQTGGDWDAQIDSIISRPLVQVEFGDTVQVEDGLLAQQGIAAARAEYTALGYDMGALQLNYLLFTALKMMGFVVLSVIISAAVSLVASRTGAKIGRSLRSRLFSKVMTFSDAEVQRFSAASLITRGTNDIQQIQMMCIMVLRMVLYAPILAVGGVIMVARTDLSMGWVIGAAILAIFVVAIGLSAIVMPKFRIMQKLIDRVNLVSREMLSGVSVVRAFGQQAHEQERFDEASTELMRTQLFTNRVMTFLMPAMFLILNMVSIVIVWVGAQAVDAGTIQTGDLIAFITYSMIIIMGFLMLSMLAVIAPRADVSAGRIDEVLEADVSIADPAEGAVELRHDGGATIQFDHVSFRYDADSEDVLHDVSFTAEAGKTLAIVGSTGSGKSTIVKLIERFYDVTEGAVLIDGVDVRSVVLSDLRAQLGYVPQKAFLFTGTIESNVGFGEDQPDVERILEAIDIAQATELLQAKEDGLDAEVTQGGTNVSGGQRQRLAIARALATDARAFLFDDSFSALDYKTDAALRRALSQRLPGKTQIVVAQRIATVLHADKIIVLDDGCAVGEGTHGQLLRTCEQYREIAYSQLSPEELEGALGDQVVAAPVAAAGLADRDADGGERA